MSLDSIEHSLRQMNNEIENIRNEYKKKTQDMFSEMCKEIFNVVDNLKQIAWVQYTPYFNDGEECIFRVNELEFYFTDEDIEEGYQYGETNNPYEKPSHWFYANVNRYPEYQEIIDRYEESIKNDPNHGVKAEILSKFKKIFESIDKNTFKDMFGDHCIVVVKRDGSVEVEEYSHD